MTLSHACISRHRPTGCPSLLLQLTNKRIISYVLPVLALMTGQLTISIYRPNFGSGYFKPLFYYSVNYSRRTRNQAGFIEPRKKINTSTFGHLGYSYLSFSLCVCVCGCWGVNMRKSIFRPLASHRFTLHTTEGLDGKSMFPLNYIKLYCTMYT